MSSRPATARSPSEATPPRRAFSETDPSGSSETASSGSRRRPAEPPQCSFSGRAPGSLGGPIWRLPPFAASASVAAPAREARAAAGTHRLWVACGSRAPSVPGECEGGYLLRRVQELAHTACVRSVRKCYWRDARVDTDADVAGEEPENRRCLTRTCTGGGEPSERPAGCIDLRISATVGHLRTGTSQVLQRSGRRVGVEGPGHFSAPGAR